MKPLGLKAEDDPLYQFEVLHKDWAALTLPYAMLPYAGNYVQNCYISREHLKPLKTNHHA